jgi:hypothetical protein
MPEAGAKLKTLPELVENLPSQQTGLFLGQGGVRAD